MTEVLSRYHKSRSAAGVPALSTPLLQNATNQNTKEKRNENRTNVPTCFDRNSHHRFSAPEAQSALRGLMQRLGLTLLACTLVLGVTGSASAGDARDEAAVRALGDSFAKAFVQKNAELRASLFAENGTFVTPVGDFLQGRVAMVKDFGPEAEQA